MNQGERYLMGISILEDLLDQPPHVYDPKDLIDSDNLFRDRTALFFTPTENIPSEWIGTGPLDIFIPLASPTLYEWYSNPAFKVPRLWVDLIQRATGKIRWEPLSPSKVTLVRYDTSVCDLHAFSGGAKALIDALIVKTAGRRDGRILHYFGAIQDDNWMELTHMDMYQKLIDEPSQARTRIIVEPAPNDSSVTATYNIFGPDREPPR